MATPDRGLSRRQFVGSLPLLALAPGALAAGLGAALQSDGGTSGGGSNGGSAGGPGDSIILGSSNVENALLKAVPEPILPSRPDLINLYRACWLIGYRQTNYGTPLNGFVRWFIDEAFDARIFQWDTCFSLAWAKYGQGAFPSIESLDNFYRKQHADGAISGVIRESDGTDDQPTTAPWFTRNNLFSWAEWEHYQLTGDASRFARVVPILANYARWVQANRRHPNGHYFWSGGSSGMDNSPRSVADQFYPPYSWVDHDANEALAAHYLVKLAEVLGDAAIVDEFSALHAEIKALVNAEMWNDADQFYWDLNSNGTYRKVKTVASFWPLWGRITEPNHAAGLVGHLNDTASFRRLNRVPTLAADHAAYDPHGNYWRGSVWAPTNHMITQGLMTQGYDALAREIVVNHLACLSQVFQTTGTVWENYAPDYLTQGNNSRSDFVGWTGVGPIAELIENYIGIRASVPTNTIEWALLTTEAVGLRNFDFGGVTIELRVAARASASAPVALTAITPLAFTLRMHDGCREVSVNVVPGTQSYVVDFATGRLRLVGAAVSGPGVTSPATCADSDADGDVDLRDVAVEQRRTLAP